jgi:hypothetical protein
MSNLAAKAMISSATPGIIVGSAAGLLGSALLSNGTLKDHARRAVIGGMVGGGGKLVYDLSDKDRRSELVKSHKEAVVEDSSWPWYVHGGVAAVGGLTAPGIVSKFRKTPANPSAPPKSTKVTRGVGAIAAGLLSILGDWGATKLRTEKIID